MLTMTDEEIIDFAEKTKKEKYCDKFNNCWECPLFAQYGQISECCDSKYRGGFYKKIFLDGFNAAMEFVKSKASDVRKWYENNNDISYEEGGKDALIDLLEEIER